MGTHVHVDVCAKNAAKCGKKPFRTSYVLLVEIMFRFPVCVVCGPPKTLHVENMKFFQKQPLFDAEHVTTGRTD